MQLDKASSHGAKRFQLLENMEWMFQPSYSPKLNPSERLWQHRERAAQLGAL
ncbi:transposase [Nitrosococcus oceani]|uniref:transposase n=1 Tax=Nitrosococcus oceani TaxID=1229 RepID=UPI0034D17E0D